MATRRRTFGNMRVRGTLQVDTLLVNKGVVVAPQSLYLAKLELDTGTNTFTLTEGINQFGPTNWQRLSAGRWVTTFPRHLNLEKMFATGAPPFFDADGVLVIPRLGFGNSLTQQTSIFGVEFFNAAGETFDPYDFSITVQFEEFR